MEGVLSLGPLVVPMPVIKAGHPMSMLNLAAQFRPGWVKVFLLAKVCYSPKYAARAEARLRRLSPDYDYQKWEIRPLVAKELTIRQSVIEIRRYNVLWQKIEPVVRSAWASGLFRFRGTLPSGERSDLPVDLAYTARIGIEADTVSLPNGGPTWFGVTAERLGAKHTAIDSPDKPLPQLSDDPELKASERPRPRGRPPRYDWPRVEAVLLQRLSDDGAPAAGDGGQARLEDLVESLFPPDDCPSESLIRTKVSAFIKKFRCGLEAE